MDVFSFQSQSMKEKLYHDQSQTIIHLSLKAGQEIPKHSGANAIVTVIPVKGEVVFSAQEQSEVLVPGKVIRLHANERHALKALKDSDLIIVKWLPANE